MTIEYEPIGVIHTPFTVASGMPRNPAAARDVAGTVEIDPRHAAGLKDLDGFSHIILLFHCHRSEGYQLVFAPPGHSEAHGVFATRSPRRPNPIGLSVVRLDRIDGNRLEVRGVDMVDGTPLLDLKPYLPSIDVADEIRTGWLDAPAGPGDADPDGDGSESA